MTLDDLERTMVCQSMEISMWNPTHPNRLFRKTIFWPLGGAAPPNFYTRHRITTSW